MNSKDDRAEQAADLERKRVESAQLSNESFLRIVYDNVGAAIFVVDVGQAGEFRYVGWNYIGEAITGIKSDQASGRSPEDVFGPIIGKQIRERYAKCVNEGTLIYEERFTTNREDTWSQTTLTVQRDDSGGACRILGFATDITQRKRAEEALWEIQQRLQEQLCELNQIYQCSPVGLYVLDSGLRFLRLNERLAEIDGISVEEHLGRTVSEIVPHLADRLQRLWRPVFEKGESVLNVEIQGETPKAPGEQRYWLASYFPVKTTVGEVTGLMAAVVEITERKRAEQSLATANAELEARVVERTAELKRASGKLRDELEERKRAEVELQVLSRRLIEVQESERRHLAHELHDEIGQILTGVSLMLATLSSLPPPAMAKRLAEAQQLVGDLLQRVQDMSLTLRPGVLDDFGLLPALEGLFRRYTSQTGVKVVFECHLAARRFVPELETASYRVVQEALTNVARHAGVADVSVRTWAEDDMLGLEISDRGTGFDAQAVLVAGTSSGLPGMRERVLLLRGSLTIRSAPGRGTELSIRLPIQGLDRSRGGRHGRARGS